MADPLPDATLDQMFRQARTRNAWLEKTVPETLIRAVYDLAKMGPTSANCSPARFVFVTSQAGKARLSHHLLGSNVAKTMAAPWTVIIATDMQFYEKMAQLFPHNPGTRDWFSAPEAAKEHGMRNGSLQGAYLLLAARSLGLDCGPMSGFDADGVDREFFAKEKGEMQHWKSNFLCNIGFGSEEGVFARLPRLSFEEACKIV
jgi:3-hydroxypropanoate dehydrogenase